MVECTCRKIYETSNKVGVYCFHPERCNNDDQPKRITCGLVCEICPLDKTVEQWSPYVGDPEPEPEEDQNPDD